MCGCENHLGNDLISSLQNSFQSNVNTYIELQKLDCPKGYLPILNQAPVRHAIDLSLLPPEDLQRINTEFSWKYREPLYNTEKRRLSFLTEGGQCRNVLKWDEILSRDPKIHTFNADFLNANPHLQKKYNLIKTYDFREEQTTAFSILRRSFINGTKKLGEDFAENPTSFLFPPWLRWTLGVSLSVVIIGGVAYYAPKKAS